jgi:hypothetical protein
VMASIDLCVGRSTALPIKWNLRINH